MQDMKTVRVTLKQAHTHAGVDYPAGVEIDVPEHDKLWLEANGVAGAQPSNTKRGTAAEEK
jgi:hypothetical protein